MAIGDLEFQASTVRLIFMRPGASEPEVEFDEFIAKARVCLVPEDEATGPIMGIRLSTRGESRTLLLMLTPTAASLLALQIARAILETDEE